MPALSRPTLAPGPVPFTPARSSLIEIELGNARHVRVGKDVNLAALRRVLAALGD
ncbi:MAG TPA: hypothetical protein VE650_02655 [Acetobacteraceae bacterium]|nr:hypothetical protein [Acetobacteraceae bacterium]